MDPRFALQAIFVVVVGVIIVARLTKHFEDANLKKQNPDAWIRMKEIENAERQRRHEQKTMGMKMRWSIASWFFRLWQ